MISSLARSASLGGSPPRIGFYARVSSEEQTQGYSIDAQLRAGQQLATERGLEFTSYVEPGRSAKGEDLRRRPVFQQLLNDAEAGRLAMVAVHKLDRFSRNLRVTLEQFERLSRAGVTFVSLTENLDFSTPWGRLALAMLGALAQFYSENLGQETSKGKQERKAQGLYNGLIPFGMVKGPDRIPIPDTRELQLDGTTTTNLEGLRLAFHEAAKGHTDAEVAKLLNGHGYRATGNRGRNLFTKDTVAAMLQNRFYLGELPKVEKIRGANGKLRNVQVGWMPGKHAPVIDEQLFTTVQESRARNRTNPLSVRSEAEPWSLSGLVLCVECESKLHIESRIGDRRRVECYARKQGLPCSQRSAFLDVYEAQVHEYLRSFHIPEDYQERILAMYLAVRKDLAPAQQDRGRLESRLERLKEMYEWGDVSREKYLAERTEIQKQLAALAPADESGQRLDRLAGFLRDVAGAWEKADQRQRNRIARRLFQQIWVENKKVVAVKPQPQFKPFFDLDCQSKVGTGGSDGIQTRGLSLDKAAG